MNNRNLIRRWWPTALVVTVAATAALLYRHELAHWFRPPAPAAPAQTGHQHDAHAAHPATPEASRPDDAVAYYTCSMHPFVRASEPGNCPVCNMKLTPVTFGDLRSGAIVVEEERRQLIGVKTGVAEKRELVRQIRAVGIVAYDQTRLADVSLKFSGWVGELLADFEGKTVTAGEPLLTIYSPELYTAQREYLDAVRLERQGDARGRDLLEASRKRLRLWDLTEAQLRQLEADDAPSQFVPILSPITGTVIGKEVVRGGGVSAGMTILRLADLSVLWIEARLYEEELPLARVGQAVEVSLSYLPDRRLTGTVAYVYPTLDEATRTGRVRVEVPNADGLLKPGMYAQVALDAPLGRRLVVPEEAVIHGGEQPIVFVDRGQGRLQPMRVRIGVGTRHWIEVLEGLSEGDRVVTSGNFLIAAESKLKAGIDKW